MTAFAWANRQQAGSYNRAACISSKTYEVCAWNGITRLLRFALGMA
jgi:hypothetical protein